MEAPAGGRRTGRSRPPPRLPAIPRCAGTQPTPAPGCSSRLGRGGAGPQGRSHPAPRPLPGRPARPLPSASRRSKQLELGGGGGRGPGRDQAGPGRQLRSGLEPLVPGARPSAPAASAGACSHAAREQAARPGPLLSRRGRGDPRQPNPSRLAPGLRATPRSPLSARSPARPPPAGRRGSCSRQGKRGQRPAATSPRRRRHSRGHRTDVVRLSPASRLARISVAAPGSP